MIDGPQVTPMVVRKTTIAGRTISIAWGKDSAPYVSAADVAGVIGVETDTILSYSKSRVMKDDWQLLGLPGQEGGVACVRVSALPGILSAIALGLGYDVPYNLVLDTVGRDAVDAMARRWRLDEPGFLLALRMVDTDNLLDLVPTSDPSV